MYECFEPRAGDSAEARRLKAKGRFVMERMRDICAMLPVLAHRALEQHGGFSSDLDQQIWNHSQLQYILADLERALAQEESADAARGI